MNGEDVDWRIEELEPETAAGALERSGTVTRTVGAGVEDLGVEVALGATYGCSLSLQCWRRPASFRRVLPQVAHWGML